MLQYQEPMSDTSAKSRRCLTSQRVLVNTALTQNFNACVDTETDAQASSIPLLNFVEAG